MSKKLNQNPTIVKVQKADIPWDSLLDRGNIYVNLDPDKYTNETPFLEIKNDFIKPKEYGRIKPFLSPRGNVCGTEDPIYAVKHIICFNGNCEPYIDDKDYINEKFFKYADRKHPSIITLLKNMNSNQKTRDLALKLFELAGSSPKDIKLYKRRPYCYYGVKIDFQFEVGNIKSAGDKYLIQNLHGEIAKPFVYKDFDGPTTYCSETPAGERFGLCVAENIPENFTKVNDLYHLSQIKGLGSITRKLAKEYLIKIDKAKSHAKSIN